MPPPAKERVGGCGLGLQKAGRQLTEDEKANVWQMNVCWVIFNNGTQGGV